MPPFHVWKGHKGDFKVMGHQGAGLFPNRQGDEEGEKERTLLQVRDTEQGLRTDQVPQPEMTGLNWEQRDLWFLHSFAQSIFGLCVHQT